MNKRLYVGNLEYSVTDKDLEDFFSDQGKVIYAKVITRWDGKSRGFGFVEMETEEEAKNAAEKFNQSIFKDRTIVVNEARENVKKNFPENSGRPDSGNRSRDDLDSKLRKLRKKFG
ncbi:MAG: RNA-binding protein [Actinobacteria bacterium]|nr:RNA-binding protein [Actinomycetota bacterium]